MVCKDCGAYNSDNLTECRVCGAPLNGSAKNPAPVVEEPEAEAPAAKPARNFAEAPKWPAEAFKSTASDALKEAQQKAREKKEEAKQEPDVAEELPAAEPEEREEEEKVDQKFCTSCGKPLTEGAMFCAFCGAKNGPAAETPAEKPTASKKAVRFTEPEEDDFFDDEEDEEEEENPRLSKKLFGRKKKPEPEDDFDDEDDEDDDDEEEEYDDDEEFDDDYYDDEFDDDDEDEPRRKGGSTVLFIVLILVLLALIVFFGTYILKKNYGSVSNAIATLTGKSPTEIDEGTMTTVDATPEPAMSSDDISAAIEETVVDGNEMFVINVKAPTGSSIRILSTASLEQDSVTISRDNAISLRVPRIVFLPDDYCDSTMVTVNPQLEVTLPDGTTKILTVPAANVSVPQVALELSEPIETSVEAPANGGPIVINGTVSDHTVEVLVNNEPVPVLEGGIFSYNYYPTQAEEQIVQVVARKKQNMSAVRTFNVTPYVVKDMTINITNETSALSAADGIVTLTGTAPSGSTITAVAENADVTCGTVTVTSDGSFTCIVQIPKEGCYTVNLTGTCIGYNNGTASCIVERKPTAKSSNYLKKCVSFTKKYDSILSGKQDVSDGVNVKGKVKEIVATEPYPVFALEDSSGHVYYVCSRSEKKTISEKIIKQKLEVAGYYAGLYPDTDIPYIWGWFIWNR